MQFTFAIIAAALAGLSVASPVASNERRYVPGACGVHVTQWQKNENGVGGAYQYDVNIKDAVGASVGGASRLAIGDYQSSTVFSQLPYGLVITSGAVDSDPVSFAYAGYLFSSSSGCSTGGYENGNRESEWISLIDDSSVPGPPALLSFRLYHDLAVQAWQATHMLLDCGFSC
ncbi:hypothetical protein O1611_g6067 [Lasiodiplodia mahajangana]|uniref:Uncharacterized protein n=1 Tax=Lasiodiplodia mahajangana TaxID=1108764 RepID=A0ACC2JJ46_9PEZI|nr:hypothetical protein O1611_g6067 [Lasiodiplodia mahajangana]